ncbi:hypothetical protein, partial [Escherichia coli]|uniref:hypothetical protein n=1 Tax=Escherichia coli TaxID=562 RepID=UPI001BFC5590
HYRAKQAWQGQLCLSVLYFPFSEVPPSLSKTWSLVVRTGRRHPALMESVEGIVLFPDGFANMGN